MMSNFSNRELAFFTWLMLFIIWMLSKTSVRASLLQLIKTAFAPKLTVIYLIMATYSGGVVLLLNKIGLWDKTQIKNTVIWFVSIAIMTLNDITKKGEGDYLKKAIKDIFATTAIIQFVVGVYSFNYFLELLLLPLILLVTLTIAYSETNPKYADVKNILSRFLSLIGCLLIFYTVYKVISNFYSFANKGTLNDFLIPAVLSFLFLPLVYLLSSYVAYEDAFTGINRIIKRPALVRYARWQTLLQFHIHKADLKRWRKYIFHRRINSKKDIRKSISFIKKLKKKERNPPVVVPAEGWSPYLAKDFLATEGLITEFYSPVFENDWQASSNYINIEGGIIDNNMAYYIDGDSRAAKKLKLILNIHSPEAASEAIKKFISAISLLYNKSMASEISHDYFNAINRGKSKTLITGNRKVRFEKNSWQGHLLNGYNLVFQIEVYSNGN